MVSLVCCAVETFHHQRRMYAVSICYGEMASHEGIFRTAVVVHVFCACVTSPCVNSVGDGRIVNFRTCLLCSRHSIDNTNIKRCDARGTWLVVYYAVTVDVGFGASKGIVAKRLCRGIPETGSFRRFYHYLRLAVTVDVVCHNHVVLACAYPYVRPHVDCPQMCAVAAVCLNLVVGNASVARDLSHHVVVFSVTVKVGRPCIYGIETVWVTDDALELNFHECVGIWLSCLVECELASRAVILLSVDDGYHPHSVTVVYFCQNMACARCSSDERAVDVEVVDSLLGLLCQPSPGHETTFVSRRDRPFSVSHYGNHSSSQVLLQSLGGGRSGHCQ